MKKSLWYSFALLILTVFTLSGCQEEKTPQRPSVSSSTVATMEFSGDTGYKLITSEISTLYSIDSMVLEKADGEFSEDWVYRVVFDPPEYVKGGNRIEVLFGRSSLAINGEVYVRPNGSSFDEILDWAEGAYRYFAYDRILP